jgi:hypothetical protein
MMLSIVASLASLAWALTFLALINFMFSIFFLNGATEYIRDNNYNREVADSFGEWYRSLPQTMFSLLAAISGGTDWLDIMTPVKRISWTYQMVFSFYVVFVVIGVVNVLTGVFLESAAEYRDRDLTVAAQMEHLDSFVGEMLELFYEFNPDQDGNCIGWDDFEKYLHQERVEAYLASHMLEATHAKLLFRMLDGDKSGKIDISEFVIGMYKLKGAAKAYDCRILLRHMCALTTLVKEMHQQLGRMS